MRALLPGLTVLALLQGWSATGPLAIAGDDACRQLRIRGPV
jgi:hypothetical protein